MAATLPEAWSRVLPLLHPCCNRVLYPGYPYRLYDMFYDTILLTFLRHTFLRPGRLRSDGFFPCGFPRSPRSSSSSPSCTESHARPRFTPRPTLRLSSPGVLPFAGGVDRFLVRPARLYIHSLCSFLASPPPAQCRLWGLFVLDFRMRLRQHLRAQSGHSLYGPACTRVRTLRTCTHAHFCILASANCTCGHGGRYTPTRSGRCIPTPVVTHTTFIHTLCVYIVLAHCAAQCWSRGPGFGPILEPLL